MSEWPLMLSALSSIIALSFLFYLLIKHRDFYVSEEGKKLIDAQKTRFTFAALFGLGAFLLFIGIELLEAAEVIEPLPESFEEIEEILNVVQVTLMLSAQLLMLSIAIAARRLEKSAFG